MKITTKILIICLPLTIFSILAISWMTIRLSEKALNQLAQKWLSTKLHEVNQIVKENHLLLTRYALQDVPANIKKAQNASVRSIHSVKIGRSGFVLVVDTSGTILASPHEDLIDTDVSTQSWFHVLSSRENVWGRLVYGGEHYLTVNFFFEPWQWHILACASRREIYGEVNQMRNYVLAGTLLSVVVVALALIMTIRKIAAPLHLLAKKAERIGEGELETSIYVDSSDEIGILAKAFTTMTERLKGLLADLQASERKYRSIFENTLEGIYQTTPEGRIVSINPAAARILGYDSPDDLTVDIADLGKQLYVNSLDRETFIRILREEGEVNRFETQLKKKDGSSIWVELSARGIKDSEGNLILIEGLMADTTAQKNAQQQQAKLLEQLQQSQKMEALGNLTGGIAHDFNNLLQAISGNIQLLLLKKTEKEEDYKYLKDVRGAADRACELVRRMLTFSRKMEVRLQPVKCNEIIRDSVKLLEHAIPKMVAIETKLVSDLSVILADQTQLEQVVMNLVNNAVDAMEESGTLYIESDNFTVNQTCKNKNQELLPGNYIRIQVTDTGKGMDEATLLRIFEPFFTTKKLGKGTGLGLATVYGIVKGHNGYIYCYSELGRGTTFSIYLPTGDVSIEQEAPEVKAADAVKGGTETILLIDDEEIILLIAEEILQLHGYSILKARSGEEALAIYSSKSDTVGLIIMDLGMPGMGGEKCLQELLRTNPEVKVIVASGYAAHKIAKEPHRFGAAGFISKPYHLNELVATVSRVIDSR